MRIVTSASDGTVRVWNALNGRRELEMKHERGWNWNGGNDAAVSNVVSAEFCPDGKRIFSITSGNSRGLRIWDAQSGRRVEPPFLEEVKGSSYDNLHTNKFNAVSSVQFSPVGNRLAVSCAGLSGQDIPFADVLVCDQAGDKPPIRIVEDNVLIGMAQFSPNGRQILTAGDNGTVRVWDAQTGRPATNPMKVGGRISAAQFSPDGKRVLAVSEDRLTIWDVQDGQLLTESLRRRAPVSWARFSPDGRQVLTIDADGVAEVWEERSAQSQPEILKHGAGIVSAHFNPDGTRIVTAGNDGVARIWDVAAGQPVLELKDGTNTVTGNFSSDGRRMLTIASNSEARVWDAQSGRRMMELGLAGIDWAEFSPDGARIVTVSNYWVQGAGATATVRIWDAGSGQPVTGPLQYDGNLVHPRFSPDGTRILTRNGYGPLQLWDARNGNLLMPALGSGVIINGAEFSPDGTRVATVPGDGIARVWNTQNGREQTRPMAHIDSFPSIAFSPNGNRLITASPEDGVQIWDAWTGQPLMAPLDRDDEVRSAEYSCDGELILSVSPKTGARIWDARSGEPLTEPLAGAGCRQAELSPDGRRMLVRVNNEEVQVWDVSPFQEKPPGWVFELLEALSGRVLNKQGILEESRLNRAVTLKEIRKKLSRDSSRDDWSLLGRWYLADPTARTVSPFSRAGIQPSH
jgi:WD40 repeat protein